MCGAGIRKIASKVAHRSRQSARHRRRCRAVASPANIGRWRRTGSDSPSETQEQRPAEHLTEERKKTRISRNSSRLQWTVGARRSTRARPRAPAPGPPAPSRHRVRIRRDVRSAIGERGANRPQEIDPGARAARL
jgi:hypothetical protein